MSILNRLFGKIYKFIEIEFQNEFKEPNIECDIISTLPGNQNCNVDIVAVDSGIVEFYYKGQYLGLIHIALVGKKIEQDLLITKFRGRELIEYARIKELIKGVEYLQSLDNNNRKILLIDGDLQTIVNKIHKPINNIVVISHIKNISDKNQICEVLRRELRINNEIEYLLRNFFTNYRLSTGKLSHVLLLKPIEIWNKLWISYVQYTYDSIPILVQCYPCENDVEFIENIKLIMGLCIFKLCRGYPILLYLADRFSRIDQRLIKFTITVLNKLTEEVEVYEIPFRKYKVPE